VHGYSTSKVVVTDIQVHESGNNQIIRFENRSLLFDNDELTTCKEAMMGPHSVKWLEAIKSMIVPYTRNQISELERPSKGMKPNEHVRIYKDRRGYLTSMK
jgi:hypothetical protein